MIWRPIHQQPRVQKSAEYTVDFESLQYVVSSRGSPKTSFSA